MNLLSQKDNDVIDNNNNKDEQKRVMKFFLYNESSAKLELQYDNYNSNCQLGAKFYNDVPKLNLPSENSSKDCRPEPFFNLLQVYKDSSKKLKQKSIISSFGNLLTSILLTNNKTKTRIINTKDDIKPTMQLTVDTILKDAKVTDNYISLFDLISKYNLADSQKIVYVRTLLDDNYYQTITYNPSNVLHKLKYFNYKDDKRISIEKCQSGQSLCSQKFNSFN